MRKMNKKVVIGIVAIVLITAAFSIAYATNGNGTLVKSILPGAITDEKLAYTSVTVLRYYEGEPTKALTAGKRIVANGTSLDTGGAATVTEGGLTSIGYLVVTCTSNTTLYAGAQKTGANTFSVQLYNLTTGLWDGSAKTEYINWTAIGTWA